LKPWKAKDNQRCSFVTRRERDWVEWSANETAIFTDSWINPAVSGLPLKRHSAIG